MAVRMDLFESPDYYQLDEFNYNWTKLIQMATSGNPTPT
jgi:hypothetical protein